MKASISLRRQKKAAQSHSLNIVNPISENILPLAEMIELNHKDFKNNFESMLQINQSFKTEITHLSKEIIDLKKSVIDLNQKVDKKDSNSYVLIKQVADEIVQSRKMLSEILKKDLSQLATDLTKILDKKDLNSSLIIKQVLDEIIQSQITISDILKQEIRKFTSNFVEGKKERDLERTISFQLGKEIINSSKNIQSIITLPKKLYQLRQETIVRKNIKEKKLIEVKPLKIDDSKKVIKPLKLEDILPKRSKDFDGNLINCLGLKTHEIINVKKDGNTITLQGSRKLDKAHYFYSDVYVDKNKILKFITNGSIEFESEVEEKGVDFEFIISFFDTNKNRLFFSIVKPNKKAVIKVPAEYSYVRFGIKLLNSFGISVINRVYLDGNAEIAKDKKVEQLSLKNGISIVIPSYKGDKTILDTLNSIASQKNIDMKLLEIICIINGEIDNTPNIIKEFNEENKINIKLLYSDKKGASAARNLGIKKSTHEYLVFIDDDDMVSETYISDMFDLADKESLVLSYINDLDQFGTLNCNTRINEQLKKSIDNPTIFNTTSAITMVASKLLVTELVKSIQFNENLKSGEDVSFFTEYVQKFNPKIKIVESQNCAYIRRIVENSVSRQPLSFDFNVKQRLDVIKELENVDMTENKVSEFTLSKIRAQIGFIVNYLKEYPDKINLTLEEIILRKILYFPYDYFWEKLGKLEAEQVVFSYCHPPFVDTSATIVGKRIHQFGLLSDVIANDMSSNRNIDPEMMFLDQHYIKNLSFLNIPASFGGWSAIKQFVEQSNTLAMEKNYRQIYSRVLWPASNFAAAQFKLKNPLTKWIAEFSDPVVLDIEGNERLSEINDSDWMESILEHFNGKYDFLKLEKNLYIWCELLAYLFADEIIFTCDNQRKLMLDKFKYKDISQLAYKKSIIMPHPKPSSRLYDIHESGYRLNPDIINFGYFGVFYKNRKINDLIEMLKDNKISKSSVRIHLFTSNVTEVTQELTDLNVIDFFIINEYVSYFEFLNISKKMDVLIVNDAKVSEIFGFNPYLPSKVSDYLGSNNLIWAFVENGSALSNFNNIPFKTYINDGSGTKLSDVIEYVKESKVI